MNTSIRPLCLAAAILGSLSPAYGDDKKIEFEKDILPIFRKSCIECHGPEKQKGKLRLDSKADAFKDPEVLGAGKADKSKLYELITLPPGHEDIMPNKGEPLTKAQTDLIRDWINQGAAWPDNLVIKAAEDPNAEKDPRAPIKPSDDEQKAVAQLQELGIQVRPVAINVTWSLANFRGIDSNNVAKAMPLLAKIQTLEDLNLAGVPLKDDQLKHLAGLMNLTRLHLEKTPVTDAGLAHLKSLTNLLYLNLYNTEVTDAGLNHLTGLKRLKNLYVWQTKVTEEGSKSFQASLPKTAINRGWELAAVVKAEEKKEEKKEEAKKPEEKKDEAKKPEEKKEKAEAKKDEKPEAKAEAKKEEKPEAKPDAKPEAKPEAKKDEKPQPAEKPKEEKKDN